MAFISNVALGVGLATEIGRSPDIGTMVNDECPLAHFDLELGSQMLAL